MNEQTIAELMRARCFWEERRSNVSYEPASISRDRILLSIRRHISNIDSALKAISAEGTSCKTM